MRVFGDYSKYYDLLYKDKNYSAETDYISKLLKRHFNNATDLLELGCGTGKHAILLAKKGYNVSGLDFSSEMLEKAEKNKKYLPSKISSKLNFSHGDIRNFNILKKYDAVISLFHVISYQTSNDSLIQTFKCAKKHLKKEGVLIFDCWYGPAVLTDRPTVRVKRLEDDKTSILRIAEPVMFPNDNIVIVNYTINITDKKTKKTTILKESHPMRYLFKTEIEMIMEQTGLELQECEEWLTGKPPGCDTWGVCFIAKL
ncbi:MAG: class I SAM-dependent methyltransferase [Candidatus Wallbacteria bacterium]|nr:class I SAM-dependent methyltransferase [Candidatus Wallbacteria bacterium]